MKLQSIQSKILITIIAAMLTITLFVGGLSIVEVSNFVRTSSSTLINTTCQKESAEINRIFADMEKSVIIMESYIMDSVSEMSDITDRSEQDKLIQRVDDMFSDVAENTDGAIAYYLRLDPAISDSTTGIFYNRTHYQKGFVRLAPTDISLYEKDDTERVGWFWQPYEAGKPIWMMPYYNDNVKTHMISYIIPLYHNDEFFGIVGMDFEYTVLTEKINKIKIYKNGFAHLENEGIITYHRDLEPGSKSPDISNEYMQVSQELDNGMTLVLSVSYNDLKQIRHDIAFKILFAAILVALFFSLIAVIIVKKLVRPLRKLTEAAKNLSEGNYDIDIPKSNIYEIKLLSTTFEKMTEHLLEHNRLQHQLAYRDSLTGLKNTTSYKAWTAKFDSEIDNHSQLGIILFDMNNLKTTNDKFGHDAGNMLIITVAQCISSVFNEFPVFRIGGDEFLVLLEDENIEKHELLIASFDNLCNDTFVTKNEENIPVSVAKGFAQFNPDTDKCFADVFSRADDAMYKNKRKMKGLD